MLNLSDPAVLGHIQTIGYPLMLLTMIIEGPVVTILAAFAASLGFFNVYVVLVLSMLGDIIGDIILYTIGYTGGAKTLAKAEKILKIKPAIVAKIEALFHKHGKKTIFAVKSTTGLCWITFIAAGAVRMNFRDFLRASFLGGIVWSGFLVAMGYFFGYAFDRINDYLRYAGILIFFSAVIFYTLITLYKKRQSTRILAE
ncbi:MAG: DedA family protein [Parcubacteria group bacterium]|jgi:membrane protein DedA with SNARE-associated domain